MRIAVRGVGHEPSSFVSDVRSALTARGVVEVSASGSSPSPVVLAVEAVSQDVLDLVGQFALLGSGLVLVVIGAPSVTPEATWDILGVGASDVIAWSRHPDPVAAIVARLSRWNDIDELLEHSSVRARLVGRSRVWRTVLRELAEAARFSSGPVLLVGETGTGKELAARMLHDLDPRQDRGELIVVDCTTIVPDLAGSEFYGHERGAFTTAISEREGAFALADRGTLFLDEVGELPLALQAGILRVVQEGTYKRVGGSTWKQTNFRLVAATNRDIDADRERGTFRQDLYYRLVGTVIRLPPLAERRDDIPYLVRHFLRDLGREAAEVDADLMEYLLVRAYPGNVRELRQVVHRLTARDTGAGPITLGALPEDERRRVRQTCGEVPAAAIDRGVRAALTHGWGLDRIRIEAARAAYRAALVEEGGDTAGAARRLRISPRAVQLYMKNERSRGPAPDHPTRSTAK